VVAFHHIPCGQCFYCARKLYAQCAVYKKVGITAGFEPAGGGFSQYVRVMDWIVERGVEKIPAGVSFDQASFVEPVNTCLKGVKLLDPQAGDVVAVLGQGPIGLIFTRMVARGGARVVATDTMAGRREKAISFGAEQAFDPRQDGFDAAIRAMTDGRGADSVIVATSARGIVEQAVACSRPGAKILLFAQTSHQERIEVSGADICMGRGCFWAPTALRWMCKKSRRNLYLAVLAGRRTNHSPVSIKRIHLGIERALHPDELSLKIVVQPQR